MTIELPQEVIRKLKATAEESGWGDTLDVEDTDTCVDVYVAYNGGERTGRIEFARELCDKLGIAYTDPRDE